MWGKKRSKFGKWMDEEQEEYNQNEFAKAAGISADTMVTACSKDDWIPSAIVMKKIMAIVRKVDPGKRSSDFWDV